MNEKKGHIPSTNKHHVGRTWITKKNSHKWKGLIGHFIQGRTKNYGDKKGLMKKAAAQLTHCSRKLHQTRGADFHLELVPSAKYRSKRRKTTQISMTKHMTWFSETAPFPPISTLLSDVEILSVCSCSHRTSNTGKHLSQLLKSYPISMFCCSGHSHFRLQNNKICTRPNQPMQIYPHNIINFAESMTKLQENNRHPEREELPVTLP